ncbi:hypothetical protein LK994_14290 [Ferruginibacter lapsinanis]|uniref:hypothetical protein n=1 Tax=Ferruginibacter lapsinanis TaxID=563172 RepID=UPI001E3FEB2B|nr:hypothetical protein [Ferruginibacter lapsinanis]UEG49807.1 hypothetical protein LK994_14290 [Ferruginibacter lapsinanis]
MKAKFLLIALSIAAASSCTSAYRSGQTPDDVYFSPARTYEENRKDDNRDDLIRQEAQDRVIRLGINDYRYRNLDYDYYDYSYYPYKYGYDYGYYYNPYYYPYPVYNNPITPAPAKPNTTPRKTDLSSYNNGYNNTNSINNNNKLAPKMGAVTPSRTYNNNNTNYNNYNSNTNTNSNNTTRSYTPSTNNNSSSSSSSSSSGNNSSGTPVSRPSRSGN